MYNPSYRQICTASIPGRDIAAPNVPSRIVWLRRYLAERAAFSWSATYQEKATELARLEAGK